MNVNIFIYRAVKLAQRTCVWRFADTVCNCSAVWILQTSRYAERLVYFSEMSVACEDSQQLSELFCLIDVQLVSTERDMRL